MTSQHRSSTSYDVRIWAIRTYKRRKRTTYGVPWIVAGASHHQTFVTFPLADSFRSDLVSAARRGEAFDVETGLPVSLVPVAEAEAVSWFDFACGYVDMKWPHMAPKSRQGIADTLATVTDGLLDEDARGKPDAKIRRKALVSWAFNPRARSGPVPEDLRPVIEWLRQNTVPVADLAEPKVARRGLNALAVTLNGKIAAASTIARKRAVFYNALDYAVEEEHLPANPIPRVKWKAPQTVETVDRRVVVDPTRARALLAAVEAQGPVGKRLKAFFACMYYAAMRPAEVTELAVDALALDANDGWGEILLSRSTPVTNSAWTDTGRRDSRQLKHRGAGDVRPVPCPPELSTILRWHLDEFGTAPDGRLFRAVRGNGLVSDSVYGRIWHKARKAALTPAEVASPLAGRPYDLRHTAVSTWLNAGVPATQVAEWAGHSVHVLLRIYAKTLIGQDKVSRRRIDEALGGPPAAPDEDEAAAG